MMNDGGGEVFIAAAGDRYNVPDYAVYASCKGAVEVFARCVVKEYGSRCIRANTVAPAWKQKFLGGSSAGPNHFTLIPRSLESMNAGRPTQRE